MKTNVHKHQYADLKPTDFDKFDCVKISPIIYLALMFVLKAYLVWILTVTNMQDRASIIQFFYPDKWVFFVNLASGAVGILALVVLTLRRPDTAQWVKWLWQRYNLLIVFALIFDLLINIAAVWLWSIGNYQWILTTSIIAVLITICLYKSKRVNINLQEFPEKLPE
ncbi:DUF2919 family protein [Thalassotalea fusca]